jgi:hypothetical protein
MIGLFYFVLAVLASSFNRVSLREPTKLDQLGLGRLESEAERRSCGLRRRTRCFDIS